MRDSDEAGPLAGFQAHVDRSPTDGDDYAWKETCSLGELPVMFESRQVRIPVADVRSEVAENAVFRARHLSLKML
jgi:hypothetical protein